MSYVSSADGRPMSEANADDEHESVRSNASPMEGRSPLTPQRDETNTYEDPSSPARGEDGDQDDGYNENAAAANDDDDRDSAADDMDTFDNTDAPAGDPASSTAFFRNDDDPIYENPGTAAEEEDVAPEATAEDAADQEEPENDEPAAQATPEASPERTSPVVTSNRSSPWGGGNTSSPSAPRANPWGKTALLPLPNTSAALDEGFPSLGTAPGSPPRPSPPPVCASEDEGNASQEAVEGQSPVETQGSETDGGTTSGWETAGQSATSHPSGPKPSGKKAPPKPSGKKSKKKKGKH